MSFTIAQLCFDYSIRLGKIIWLAGQSDTPNDDLKELLNEEEFSTIAKLFDLPVEKVKRNLALDDDDDSERSSEEFLSYLAREKKFGFLVQGETPIPTHFYEGDRYHSAGFGYFTSKWFYTEALDEALIVRLCKWQEHVVADARKEAAKKPKKKGGGS